MLNRLAAMASPAGVLAEAVAVFEDEVPLHIAAALAQVDATAAGAAMDELVRADVLDPRDPLGFRHPLLRAAVYGGLPEWRRAEMHARAARLLSASGAGPEQVCAHLLLCPSRGDAAVVETLRSAARRALAKAAPASAVRYLERALREPPPAEARAAVLAELGQAEAVAGRAGAVEHLESAIELAASVAKRAELLLAFGRALHHGGRLVEACGAFRRGSTSCTRRRRSAATCGSSSRAATSTPRCSPPAGPRTRISARDRSWLAAAHWPIRGSSRCSARR